MHKEIKIAVCGLGLMGKRHAYGYDKMPLVQLTAVCDINEACARALAKELGVTCYTDLETMLKTEELDAVDIALPDNMHLGAVELAVQYHKHIMLEKPVADKLEDAEKIYALTKEYDKTFMVGHILRFDARYAGAHKILQSGQLGEGVSFYMRRNSPVAGPMHYRGVTDLSMHVMVHDIDAIQWITGSRIASVYAKHSSRVLKQYNMTDCIMALMTLENGMAGCMEACWILPDTSAGSIDDKMEIIGTKGVLYTDSCDHGITLIDQKRIDSPDSRHWPDLNGGVSGALYEELTAFVNCIVRDQPSTITPIEALSTIRVVEAIEQSIRQGKEITVKLG